VPHTLLAGVRSVRLSWQPVTSQSDMNNIWCVRVQFAFAGCNYRVMHAGVALRMLTRR
jgi:hypothetical protein